MSNSPLRVLHTRGLAVTFVLAVALVLTVALVLALPALGSQHLQLNVQDNSFQPPSTNVEAGETVTWTQSGNNPHTVTADNGSFDSHPNCAPGADCMGTGETFQVTFQSEGQFRYHCKIHGGAGGAGMSGVVNVGAGAPDPTEPPAATPPPPTPPPPTPEPTEPPAATEPPAPAPPATTPEELEDLEALADDEGGGLSSGSIAAIILGVIGLLVGAGALIYRMTQSGQGPA